MTFHEDYRPAIRRGIVWAFVLALWSMLVFDGGTSVRLCLCALGGYFIAILLVMLRRPASPTPLDLVLVGWMLPAIYFPLQLLLPPVGR